MTSIGRRGLLHAALLALLAGPLMTTPATAAERAISADRRSNTNTERRSHTGTIDGAEYRVEVPDHWNGTLVLFSHGYYPPGWYPERIALANRPETEQWLLDHGYALAASRFQGTVGYAVEPALRDQIALLDWFDTHVGRPRQTVATGQSLGAAVAVLLAERHPRRFAGVTTMCGVYDPLGNWNMALDLTFAIRTLLAPGEDIDLVRADDPIGSATALQQAVQRAIGTPQGQARIALAASFGNVPGWYFAHQPEPTDPTERILAQAFWLEGAYSLGVGPTGRADLEARAGGNPSWNVGIDYGRQLARSAQQDQVREAYRMAGLDLRADLDRLAAAPRIAADPAAVGYMYRYGVPVGSTPVPVLSLHNARDGGAVTDQERWYADQVRRTGDPRQLRQLYVNRGGHCAFSSAEEIVSLRALLSRIDSGRWPDLDLGKLNPAAAGYAEPYQFVLDLATFADQPMPPAFVRYTPSEFLRPSR
jgi:pimeloyl-ACP methyl ester carboxylesterase